MSRTAGTFSGWLGGLALLAVLAFAPGCTTPPSEKAEVVIALRGMPLTLMPHRRAESITTMVQSNLFEGLAGFDRDMKVVPLLAASWENPDLLTWQFRLRRGVVFHDGSPLTADDVVFSILRARDDPNSVRHSNCAVIAAVTRIDDYTVRLTTTRPDPVLLHRLRTVFIVPKRTYERLGEVAFTRNPVGTGPYRLVNEIPGDELRLAAHDAYWGGRPEFAAARFIRFQSADDVESLLRDGAADMAADIPPAAAAALSARPVAGMEIIRHRGLLIRYLGMDTRVQPFQDVRVRRAMALAVDRPALVLKLRDGYGTPANQYVSQSVFGFNPELPELAYDPDGARRLLAEAGHPDGVALTLLLPRERRDVGEELRRQMAPAGFRIQLNALEREAYWRAADTAPFFLMGAVSDTGDASDIFEDMIHSTTGSYGRDNGGRFHNPEIDRLIEGLSELWNRPQRLAALQETMARTMAEMPRVPLLAEDIVFVQSVGIVRSPRVDNYVLVREIRRKN
ncbi:MAG TPA: ABC transporter substrate-binding protein [Acidobacteriota bacterium]|jgi:peptide/nickel transport system substrate-binding protein|nr:ABC transporter substrate-binding protein [Acidobacteriota bacterium]